ncbi:MAG TPA: multiheme c-type cytochrome [Bryobacteraceae bacterium]|nr:multiheme c-type cytochrome [Bryobacteraceae bacterium]
MGRFFFVLLTSTALAQKPDIPVGSAFWSASAAYAGSSTCASCHPAQAKRFHENSMSRALEPVSACEILRDRLPLYFKKDAWSYSIVRAGDRVLYRVSDGAKTFEAPLQYAFGQSKAGQTYVYSVDNRFYESRVSYYAKLRALDLTVGAMNSEPVDLRSAAGRIMEGNEPRNCFGCHTTGARQGASLQLEHYEAGVQCESCHGPGGAHVDAVRAGGKVPGTIRSLRNMDPQQSAEFCGTCHRTWENVMMMGIKGINNVRFPAYRLTNSPCFSLEDRRISCTACHDPHGPLVAGDNSYDSKCAACHNPANARLRKKICPVAKQACTSCHMPRVEPAEAHHAFPDHWIRVSRSAKDYPD